MMNEKVKTMIGLFWQGLLPKEDRGRLLSDLTEREEELRRDMAEEFDRIQDDEQLHRDEDYQLYLRQILEKADCENVVQRRVRPLGYSWWLAASLWLIAGLGYLIWQHVATDTEATGKTTVYANDGAQVKVLTLKDGSEVKLYPGSSVAYEAGYGDVDRSLSLIGEAQFAVSRDTTRPFIVEAKGYTTTALGTSFVVDARQRDRIRVRLLTGKVVVKSTPQTRYAIADQYLLPGEELAIGVDRLLLEKNTFIKEPETPAAVAVPKQQPAKKKPEITVDLHFEETPLAEVLRRIAKTEHIRFDLADVDLQELYFTGDFSEKDALETMLDIIGTTNSLEYEKQPDGSVKFRHAGRKNEKQK